MDLEELEEISLEELKGMDLDEIPENAYFQIFESNFPNCTLMRESDFLRITIEEHIYTKYWYHKYHAIVFAEAMIRAIKRLRVEGISFENEKLESDDDVHIFVRWDLVVSITIENLTLIEKINSAFDCVFERANSMLENSDSVLILGKDTGSGMDLLKQIQVHLENLGFYTYIIKELPDKIGESVMQKVLRYGLSSKFVIIENSEPTGHLYEFPHITKLAELTTIVLQRENEGATWMFEDLYHRHKNITKIEYTDKNIEEKIKDGVKWANDYLESFGEYQKQKLPWLKSK
jgi:hypothetical protein